MTDNIGRHMELVARHLLGEPNKALSSKMEWRYGERGSLKVNLEDGLWHDFERDEKGGVFKLITRETGTQAKDVPAWLNKTLGIQLNGESGQLIATYPYTDESGNLLYEVLRYDPKNFVQRRPNGMAGEYIWGLGNVRRVPWRLPRLMARGMATIYITEGEKDALTLEAWGLLATTNSGGAGQWRDEFKRYLKGADVVIVPHNDEAGEARTAKIVKSLTGTAARITTVTLPGLPPKEDVTWWRQQGGTKEEFLALCDEAEPPQGLETVKSALERRMDLGLDIGKTGVAIANLNNASIIIARDPNLKDIVWYDEFLQRIMTDNKRPREWTDADDIKLAIYIQNQIGISRMTQQMVSSAIIAHARDHPRNCVKDWLEELEWDGVPRLSQFFVENFGAKDTEYAQAVGRNFFIGMIARIYKPGCQLKYMVILEGVQDASKSSALIQLVGDAWFTEQHESVMSKGFFEVLQGKWLIEIPEMDAFTRVETSRVKAVVSCRTDRYRVPWDRHASDHPRQCTFVGTTNKEEGGVFNDDTGAVRFWPIYCFGPILMDVIGAQREQLFAEAVHLYQAGAAWWHVPKTETETEQKNRFIQDVWHDKILDYADTLARNAIPVTVTQLLSDLGKKTADQNRADQMRVASCLKVGGWKRKQANDGKWHYIKD